MGQDVAKIEPIIAPEAWRPLADGERPRPVVLPSLPVWASSRLALLQPGPRPREATRDSRCWTLPREAMLSPAEHDACVAHVGTCERMLALTPEANRACEAATLVLVTKMMLSPLAAARATEESAQATGEAYMTTLEDVPVWATEAALRGWYRGDSVQIGKEPHEFKYRPAPAIWRRLAMLERARIETRASDLRKLAAAQARDEPTAAELIRGRKAWRGLVLAMRDGKLEGLTFERAIELAEDETKETGADTAAPVVARETKAGD